MSEIEQKTRKKEKKPQITDRLIYNVTETNKFLPREKIARMPGLSRQLVNLILTGKIRS